MKVKVGDRTVNLPTRQNRLDRLAEIDKEIAAATHWGALLTVLDEERQAILKSLNG
jgi:hypothetical protein